MKFTVKKSKLFKTIVWSLFLLYLALLIKVIFFKDWPMGMIRVILQTDSGMPLSIRIKDSNFIPMKTIFYYLAGNQSFGVAKSNILGNIIAFGPFGFLLPIIKDNSITSNIAFYKQKDKEYVKFDLSKFEISKDLSQAICPNGCVTNDFISSRNGENLIIKFYKEDCVNCPLREQCFSENDLKKNTKRRRLQINKRHDAVVHDMERNETEDFKKAFNNRYIVERRFATLVRNHGLRRCRYLRLKGAKIHITLANAACNIVRMVNLLKREDHPYLGTLKIAC